MSKSTQPSSTAGVFQAAVPWPLRSDGCLQVCTAKPALVFGDEVSEDPPREEAVALATELLSGEASHQRWPHPDAPRLLVFPELAFGSGDFVALDALVRAHPAPVVLLAGFGMARGARIAELLGYEGVVAAWTNAPIQSEGSYNGGWCWIHRPGVDTCCYLFLKNFRDPNGEEPLVDYPGNGTHILRLDFDDLVLFPLICSDLICDQPRSANHRIAASLGDSGAPGTSRILIVGLLLTTKPENQKWQTTIDRFLQHQNPPGALLLVNHFSPSPSPDEEKDKWRCLTGVFIPSSIVDKPPPRSLPHVRYIQSPSLRASGLVLRCTGPGVAFGDVQWAVGSDIGHFWSLRGRFEWKDGRLELIRGIAATHEIRRYVARRRERIVQGFTAPARACVSPILAEFQKIEDEVLLWPRLLQGIRNAKRTENPDGLHESAQHLDVALGVLAALQWSLADDVGPGTVSCGQLRLQNPDAEILVWVDPQWRSKEVYEELRRFTMTNGNAPCLLVVGRGGSIGADPEPGLVRPDRNTDFTRAGGDLSGRMFTQPRLRRVHWYPLAWLHDLLCEERSEVTLRGKLTAAVRGQLQS